MLFGLPGVGKSYVAALFAQMTSMPVYDGDDFHTEEDRVAIAVGQFTLEHRRAQLSRITDQLDTERVADAILTHPVPDPQSRQMLRTESYHLVHVTAPVTLIKERLAARHDHHFTENLLDPWLAQHWHEPIGEKVSVVSNGRGKDLKSQLEDLLKSSST